MENRIIEATRKMPRLETCNAENIAAAISDGNFVVAAIANNNLIDLRYAAGELDGVLYVCKMSDSTDQDLYLTAEEALKYSKDATQMVATMLATNYNTCFVDVNHEMADMKLYFGDNRTHEDIRNYFAEPAHAKEMLYFNDNRPYED